jgi:acyl-CoA thioesterase
MTLASSRSDPKALAETVAQRMFANDAASRALGMAIAAVGPGTARVTMTVRADMLNGFAICHGGLITTLADSAFAFACNSYNQLTVAAGIAVDLLAPSHAGDELVADAREVVRRGRNGIYDITVTNQRGEVVATVRGRSHTIKDKTVLEG